VSLESLVQIVNLTLLLNNCTLSTMLFLVHLFNLFLSLNFLSSRNNLRASIHASCHHLRIIGNNFILPHLFFMNEMIGCSYGVMTICFNALNCIIAFKPMLILHQLKNLFVVRHFFFSWVKTTDSFLFYNFEPRMRSNIFD
jgi:hypothetical protein